MKYILITLLIASSLMSIRAESADYKLTQKEFLSKWSSGNLELQKSPMIAGVSPDLIQRNLESFRRKWPSFKDEMFYVGYIDSNDFRYIIFYEWHDRGCLFGVSDMAKFRKITNDVEAGKAAAAESNSYEKIDNKYCEKLLGITIPSSKGLVELPESVIKGMKPATNNVPNRSK